MKRKRHIGKKIIAFILIMALVVPLSCGTNNTNRFWGLTTVYADNVASDGGSGDGVAMYTLSYPRPAATYNGTSYPGDNTYDNHALWGSDKTYTLMNGWQIHQNAWMNVRVIGSGVSSTIGTTTTVAYPYSDKALANSKIAYCIEPGLSQPLLSQTTSKNETYWNTYSPKNKTLTAAQIKEYIGIVMQYGYQGSVSMYWVSQNTSDANNLANIAATQYLIWEVIVGERDASFNHITPSSGYSAVMDSLSKSHPLYSRIMSYYNNMVASIKNHAAIPSFMASSTASASTIELAYDTSTKDYRITLTDANGVLSEFTFMCGNNDIKFTKSGNNLTISSANPVTTSLVITAEATTTRKSVITWSSSDGQDCATYGQGVTSSKEGYLQIMTSEDDNPMAPGSGEIILTKKIPVSDINFGNGNPTFLFKLTGEDTEGDIQTYYGSLVFDQALMGTYAIADGYVSQQVVFSNLPDGTYFAEEIETSRYALENITNVVNGIKTGSGVSLDLENNKTAAATFVNRVYEHQYFSDTQIKIHSFITGY